MDLQQIEAEVLPLSEEERTELFRQLVFSLDSPSSEELRAAWLTQAQRRARELDGGSVKAVPGDEVLRKARALIG
ncbi:addiction module protein [Halomonas sp. GXIMD04776]|uniref:addiction module protein n=1 Tax=Halomonas sp. GXIMD04776 TaxID=3415605 RepID=UPI003CBE05FC